MAGSASVGVSALGVERRVARVLEASSLRWWASDGWVLGYRRDGRVAGGDVDAGVWQRDLPAALTLLRPLGEVTLDTAHQARVRIDGVSVDVHGVERAGETVSYRLGERPDLRYVFSARLFDTLTTVTARGISVPAPSPVEDYLTEHYGDWRTPTRDWAWDASPPCLRRA